MILERIISFIAPHDCLVCGVEGSLLCSWCIQDSLEPLPERCYGCQSLSDDCLVCKKCRQHSPLKHVWVRTQYGGVSKKLIHSLKFERASIAAKPMAKLIAEVLPYFEHDVIVCGVPTATSRVRQRGYDQSALIAKELADIKGLTYTPLLARLGQTRQVGAGREARKTQLKDAYRTLGVDIKGKRILLVDDVITTGATLEAAAKCLRGAGAKTVDGVVFAQRA